MKGYARFSHETKELAGDEPLTQEHQELFGCFSRTAMDKAFPCIGAQKVIRQFRVAFCLSPDSFNTPEGAARASEYLSRWSREADYAALRQTDKPTTFATAIVVFPNMEFEDEHDAERQLWQFLARVHEHDKQRYRWSSESSPFVYDSRFSMSIGGYAHFILFFSPSARTPSRKFVRPMMIFNPHFLFETMRTADIFSRWRDTIREREQAAQDGWQNPKLVDFGQGREAPQYALTLDPVFDIGPCPFTGRPRPVDMPDYDMGGHPFDDDSGGATS